MFGSMGLILPQLICIVMRLIIFSLQWFLASGAPAELFEMQSAGPYPRISDLVGLGGAQ